MIDIKEIKEDAVDMLRYAAGFVSVIGGIITFHVLLFLELWAWVSVWSVLGLASLRILFRSGSLESIYDTDFSVATVVMYFMTGPGGIAFWAVCEYDEFKWVKKCRKRGYYIPTRRKKEDYILRELRGENEELS